MTKLPRLRLEGIGHDGVLDLRPGTRPVIGRSLDSDLPLGDPTVSRRHATLSVGDGWVDLEDLGSANGTRINGARVDTGRLLPDDMVAFGGVAFRLTTRAGTPPDTNSAPRADQPLPGTVVRTVPGRRLEDAEALGRILDLAQRLSGEFDLEQILNDVVDVAEDLLPVDRVSLFLTVGPDDELVPLVTRSKVGEAQSTRVPRTILTQALEARAPVLAQNPAVDPSLTGSSAVHQGVRYALCAPLLTTSDKVVGALYADSLTAQGPVEDAHAEALFALAGLAAVSIGKIRYAEEVRRETAARVTFERFFSPEVASAIASRGAAGPEGVRRTVTVLFSDIRDFTGLAERMPPDAVAVQLTEYFTLMADLVFTHGGTLDKFIGDALLAVWGAPEADATDSDRALAAAEAMLGDVAQLNVRWGDQGLPAFRVGIGLSRGEVFAGTLGSERRLEYTVIGDAVNVASRLATIARPGEILLTEPVLAHLTDRPPVARLEESALRGKTGAVELYRVVRPGANTKS